MSNRAIEEDLAAHAARNNELRGVIESHGADLSEIRLIDFFSYASSATDAQQLASDLSSIGFRKVEVADEADNQWPVTGVFEGSVEQVTAPDFVERLVRLAANYLAEFDGWGTPI
jgi:hypothetical protein